MATAYTTQVGIKPTLTPTLVGFNASAFTFDLAQTAAGLIINDTIRGPEIPGGALLLDFFIDFPQCDTNVSPTVTWDIGTDKTAALGGVDAAGFHAVAVTGGSALLNTIRTSQVQQGTTVGTTFVHGSLPFLYKPVEPPTAGILPPKCFFQIKVHAAPATTATTGIIYGYIVYTMVDQSGVTVSTAFL